MNTQELYQTADAILERCGREERNVIAVLQGIQEKYRYLPRELFPYLAEKMGVSGIWIECMDIFAWVFVWEAVDLFFIERGMLRLKKKRLDACMDRTVRYFDTD